MAPATPLDPADAPLLAGPFCFLRHGETERNRLGLIAGSADVPLNETGRAQAREAAARLLHSGIDAIWSSPLERAHATASCVAETLGLPVSVIPELAERNWGELEGQPRATRIARATLAGAESWEEFAARTVAGLRRIPASRLPLVVAHSGTYRVLTAWLQIAPRTAPIENCLPLRFVRGAGAWSVTVI